MRIFRNAQGITLMEILITMGIVAILGTIGFTNYTGFRDRWVGNRAAAGVVESLREVQQRSRSQEDGAQWGIRFTNATSGNDSYEIFYGSSYAAGTTTITTTLAPRVGFTLPSSGNTLDIVFSKSTGLPTATSSTSTVSLSTSLGDFTDTITVNPNGRIQRVSNYE